MNLRSTTDFSFRRVKDTEKSMQNRSVVRRMIILKIIDFVI